MTEPIWQFEQAGGMVGQSRPVGLGGSYVGFFSFSRQVNFLKSACLNGKKRGQTDQSRKNPSAGFDPPTDGRFSSDHRGIQKVGQFLKGE
jgi:hypothetical protein